MILAIFLGLVGALICSGFLWLVIVDPFKGMLVMLPLMAVTITVSLPVVGERITIFDALVLIWLTGMIIRMVLRRPTLRFYRAYALPALCYYLFLVTCVASALVAQAVGNVIQEVAVFGFIGAFGVIALGLMSSAQRAEAVARFIPWILLFALAFAFYDLARSALGLPQLLPEQHETRLHGSFRNSNQLGNFIVTLLPFAWARLIFAKVSRPTWLLLLATTAGSIIVVVLTSSRTSILAVILQLGLMLIFLAYMSAHGNNSWVMPLASLFAMLAAGLSLVPVLARTYWQEIAWRVIPVLEALTTSLSFEQMLRAMPSGQADYTTGDFVTSWQAFSDHPLLGLGVGNFKVSDYSQHGLEVHNQYTAILAETGIVGGVFAGAFLALITAQAFGLLLSPGRGPVNWIIIALIVALLSVFFTGVHVRILRQRWFWLVLSLILAYAQQRVSAHSHAAPPLRRSQARAVKGLEV